MELAQRAKVHSALGDPNRLAIVDALELSDLSPSALARSLRMETNLFAHHVAVLERAGLVQRLVSSGDKRRHYLRLNADAFAGSVESRPSITAGTVLFVCTHNAARSQMAEALWNRNSDIKARSAGTEPSDRVHPVALGIATKHGLDMSNARPKSLDEMPIEPDLVVTVCDMAHEKANRWSVPTLHWSVPDPAESGTESAFEDTFAHIEKRVTALASRVTNGK